MKCSNCNYEIKDNGDTESCWCGVTIKKKNKLEKILKGFKPPFDKMNESMMQGDCFVCGTPLVEKKWDKFIEEKISAIQKEVKECLGEEKSPKIIDNLSGRYEQRCIGHNQCRAEIEKKLKEKGYIN